MIRIAEDIKSFTEMQPFWRVELPTEVVFSGDGVRELLAKLRERGRRAFFVVDSALKEQPRFAPLFAQKNLFEFDATSSEPRTSDVDSLRAEIRELADEMLRLVNEVAPALFARSGPPCVSGACPEGSMSCGRAAEMRKKYAFLKGDEMV